MKITYGVFIGFFINISVWADVNLQFGSPNANLLRVDEIKQENKNSQNKSSQTSTVTSNTIIQLPAGVSVCPLSSVLKFDPKTRLWSAPGKWKSFDISFAEKIAKFLGAQWMGDNVGKITCIYQPTDKMTFAVTIQYHDLTFTPTGGKWGRDLGGYKNCFSNNPNDCYFVPRPIPKEGEVYKEAEKLYAPNNIQEEQTGF